MRFSNLTKTKKELTKLNLFELKESEVKMIIEYNIINSNKGNDNKQLSPFLIVQVPKSKKEIKFIVDGIEFGKAKKLYID